MSQLGLFEHVKPHIRGRVLVQAHIRRKPEVETKPEPVEGACPDCGAGFDDMVDGTFYGIDAMRSSDSEESPRDDEVFIRFQACCEGQQQRVEEDGYDAAYGRPLTDVVRELTGHDVLNITGDGDGLVVARLAIVDPTTAGKVDELGRAAAASRPGWQGEVFADVEKHHRHHEAPTGHKFSIAIYNGSIKVGVAVVGRPVSRMLQQQEPHTLEVTRVTTWGRGPLRMNASSKLYAAAADRAKSLGYHKLITYTLAEEESGDSLVAAGFTPTLKSKGGSHDRASRPREGTAPEGPKIRWERGLTDETRREVAANAITLNPPKAVKVTIADADHQRRPKIVATVKAPKPRKRGMKQIAGV